MKDLLIGIDKLIEEELVRANSKFPLFHSEHEGVAVIEEEITEANDDFVMMMERFKGFKSGVYHDETEYSAHNISMVKKSAKHAVAELLQVCAMCDKFIESKEERK